MKTSSHVKSFYQVLWLVFIVGLVAGCQTSTSKPQAESKATDTNFPSWVTELPVKSGWAYGVGSAELLGDPSAVAQLARNRARLDLIRSLKVSISGQSINQITVSGNGVEQAARQRVVSNVDAFDVEGLEVAESYTSNSHVFVLMALDRNKAGNIVKRQMSEIELELEKSEPLSGSVLEQLKQLSPSLRLESQWLAKAEQYRILTGRTDTLLNDRIRQDNKKLASLLDQLKLHVTAINPDGETLLPAVRAELTGKGFIIRPSQQDADLRLTLGVIKRSQVENGREYAHLTSIVELLDPENRLIMQGNPKAKGVSGVVGRAEEKAIEQLADEIMNLVMAAILP